MINTKKAVVLDNGLIMEMNLNSLTKFQDITGKNALKSLDAFSAGDIDANDLRALFYVCFLKHQPEFTLEEAGDICLDYVNELMEAAQKSIGKSPEGTGEPSKPTAAVKKKT